MPRALEVWLPLPVPPLHYLAPHDAPAAIAGARVAVPWQGGVRVGMIADVVDVGAARALELKAAIAVLDERPWLLAPALRMLAVQARRSVVSPGLALATMVPVGLQDELVHEVRRAQGVGAAPLGDEGTALASGAWVDVARVDIAQATLETWREHGLIDERVTPRPERRRVLRAVRSPDAGLSGTRQEAQRRALEHLVAVGEIDSGAELARACDVPESAVRALVRKGYAAFDDVEAPSPPPPWAVADDQEEVEPDAPRAFPASEARVLVHGGRHLDRLAYLRSAAVQDVSSGGQVLVVAPELAAVARLARSLAASVPTLTLRGDLTPREREAAWREAARGTPLALVGTYAALTAPLSELRRVVVWDAAATSHKLVAGTRSVARRDAEALADAAGCPLAYLDVLATAELRARRPTRVLAEPLVPMRLVAADLRSSPTWPLGSDLIRTLKQVSERERQALVLVPRRGFSAGLACEACGTHVMCPNCDLPLRWHERLARLRCHQCGHDAGPPEACAECARERFAPLPGAGTEWVAREVERVVAPLPVVVLDADHRPDLTHLQAGSPGVLVATGAALRLPPLPNLSLIGLSLGDALYSREDFRAEEQALRAMLSLGDLAGGRRPLVLAQTFRPEHRLWSTLAAPDLDDAVAAFLDDVLERRAHYGYPPVMQWARVQVTHRDSGAARRAALAVRATLRTAGVPEEALLGPAPAGVARLRGRFAQHMFVRAADDAALAAALEHLDMRPAAGVQVRLDVDPYDVAVWLD